jgi:hypothetical protein
MAMMTESDFLEHYGVLGMKWGVRKDRKRQADSKVAEYRKGILKRHASNSGPISEAQFNQMSSAKVRIAPAGSVVKRLAGSPSGNLKDKTYVSVTKNDHGVYTALLAPNGNLKAPKFDLDVTVSSALVSPSKKERIETFMEVLDLDVTAPNGYGTVKGRAYVEFDETNKTQTSRALGLQTYNRFVQSQVFNTPLHTAYFEKIKSKGYTALVDDADKGIVTAAPVIVFSQQAGAVVTAARRVSKDEIVDAQLNLKPPAILSDKSLNHTSGDQMDAKELTGMMTESDFLEHYGVLGMKWGVRKAKSGPKMGPDGKPQKTRKELRSLNKESRNKDRAERQAKVDERDNQIDAARARLNSGANRDKLKAAKAKFKIDKKTKGRRAAAKSLALVRLTNVGDRLLAAENKSGRETVLAVLANVALSPVYR